MYYSDYLKHLGCGPALPTSSKTEFQCSILYSIQIFWLVIGAIGCIIQSYVAFSYLYRQFGSRTPIEALILSLSIFDLFCCFGLFSTAFIHLLPPYEKQLNCVVGKIFGPFYQYGLLLMILLLAANRFYAICRPVLYDLFFSEYKIKIYSVTILVICLLISLGQTMTSCIFKDQFVSFVDHLYKYIALSFYLLFNIPVLVLIITLYLRIQVKFRRRIEEDEQMSFITGGALDEDIAEDRNYLKSLSISLALSLILFLFDMAITTTVYWPDFDMFMDIQNQAVLLIFNIFNLSSCLLFVMNPFIFYSTSIEFRMKMARPIMALRGVVDKKYQLPMAKLSTEINPLHGD